VNADIEDLDQRIYIPAGRSRIQFDLDALHLVPGSYILGLWIAEDERNQELDLVEAAARIEVVAPAESAQLPSAGIIPCRFTARRMD
jgi:hypothetical protein